MAHICMVLISDIRYDGRVRKEIDTLVEAGHQVELIVTDYRKTRSGGEDLGIPIHYIPMRLWSRPVLNFLEQLLFNLKVSYIIKKLEPTYIHCHDLETLLAGVWVKEKSQAKIIFDAHELMPEMLGGIKEKIWNIIEKWCIRKCDYIIIPEINRISYFKKKYPYIKEALLLGNYPRRSDIPKRKYDLFRDIYPIRKEQKIILYSGKVCPGRHIEELINSFTICSEEFVLVILGVTYTYKDYDKALRVQIQNLGLTDRIFLHDAIPHKEMLQYMASCDIATVFYHNTDLNNYYCAPNKLYEFLALNKIVLTNNYPGLLETIEHFGQGECLAEVTPKSLAEAYMRACNAPTVTPETQKYFWEDQQEILLQIYEK